MSEQMQEVLKAVLAKGQTPELGPDNALPAETEPRSIAIRAKATMASERLKSADTLTEEEALSLGALVEHGKAQNMIDMANNMVRQAQRGRESALRTEIYGGDILEMDKLQNSITALEDTFATTEGGIGVAAEIRTNDTEIGGLAEEISTITNSENTEQQELDPLELLKMENMPTDNFFELDREKVYNALRRTQILPDDNPQKQKAMKILELLEQGKDRYVQSNPDATKVTW